MSRVFLQHSELMVQHLAARDGQVVDMQRLFLAFTFESFAGMYCCTASCAHLRVLVRLCLCACACLCVCSCLYAFLGCFDFPSDRHISLQKLDLEKRLIASIRTIHLRPLLPWPRGKRQPFLHNKAPLNRGYSSYTPLVSLCFPPQESP